LAIGKQEGISISAEIVRALIKKEPLEDISARYNVPIEQVMALQSAFGRPMEEYAGNLKRAALTIMAACAAILLSLAAKLFLLKNVMTYRDILLIFTVFCCVNVVVFTHLPVTAERSVSVFLLGSMAQEPERVFSEQDMEEYFISRYVRDYRAFDKRFHEQIATGTARPEGGGYVLTAKGEALIRIYDFIADCFGLDKKLIHPNQ